MNSPTMPRPRWYQRKKLWSCIIVFELIGGWFLLNAQSVSGSTPESAATAGIAFINPKTQLGSVNWVRTAEEPGHYFHFSRRVYLVGYRGDSSVANATVESFLWLGWQLRHYSIEEPSAATMRDTDE